MSVIACSEYVYVVLTWKNIVNMTTASVVVTNICLGGMT